MKIILVLVVSVFAFFSYSAIADGQSTYTKTCSLCHGAGVAGAPKFGDKVAWAPRIANGVDALAASVKSGKGAMPPKGTCMDCSDADLKAAVEYMISHAM
jgi:cytochrome c5